MTSENAQSRKRKAAHLVMVLLPPVMIGIVILIAVLLHNSELNRAAVVGFGLLVAMIVAMVGVAWALPYTFNEETGHSFLTQSHHVPWDIYDTGKTSGDQPGTRPNESSRQRVER
jgi:hypothetical protein